MSDRRSERLSLGDILEAVENAPPVAAAEVVADVLSDAIGASEVSFLIADFSGGALVRLGRSGTAAVERTFGPETADRVAVADTPHGRALTTQTVVVEEDGRGGRIYAPVTNRGEAIGVLELTVPVPPDRSTVEDVGRVAHALAYAVVANRRFTDLFEWGKRSVPLTLAAEIQHRLLPGSYTCEGGQFTVAGWLEPAGNVGGDTFDFSMARDALHLSITDAMGHSVESAVLASVFVGALRNARRSDADLRDQVMLADRGLTSWVRPGAFVTGQVARIDLDTGRASIVNAGHPPPLRLRDGRVEAVDLEVDPPFGSVAGHSYRVQQLSLETGDRLVFLTDGALERGAGDADVQALIADGAALHPREAVQQLVGAVLEATGGKLQDDATVMCVDWHGGAPGVRDSRRGADHAAAQDCSSAARLY